MQQTYLKQQILIRNLAILSTVLFLLIGCSTTKKAGSDRDAVSDDSEVTGVSNGNRVTESDNQTGRENTGLLQLNSLQTFQNPTSGWQLSGSVFVSEPQGELISEHGTGVLLYQGADELQDEILLTHREHGTATIELEFMLESESCFSLFLQGRYELEICDGSPSPFDGVGRSGFADGTAGRSDNSGLGPDSRSDGLIRSDGSGSAYSGSPGVLVYGDDVRITPLVDALRSPGVWQRLSVEFRAPELSGSTVRPAQIERIRLNGAVIHRAITLPEISRNSAFDSEVESAPLGLHVHSGRSAFRHLNLLDERPIVLSDLRFLYQEEDLDSVLDQGVPEPDSPGEGGAVQEAAQIENGPISRETDQITVSHAARGNNYALLYQGYMEIPESGTYDFESYARGEVTLLIDGERVLEPTPVPENPLHINLTDKVEARVDLEAGRLPFTLQYIKRQSGSSALSLYASGPGIRKHRLTSAVGAWRSALPISSIPIIPGRRPEVMRSHIEHLGEMVFKGLSVGDPEEVHYSLDTDNASLLYIWSGDFVDAGPIWTGRGMDPDTRMVAGIGIPENRITLSGRPLFAHLEDVGDGWPESAGAEYRFMGYRNDAAGRPTFHHQFGDLKVEETLRPVTVESGSRLVRKVIFYGWGSEYEGSEYEGSEGTGGSEENGSDVTADDHSANQDVWILIADGQKIDQRGEALYSIDDLDFLELETTLEIHQRTAGGRDELLLRLPASDIDAGDKESGFSSTYIW